MTEKNILCYGDSNTWGYIPAANSRYDRKTRWTGVLQDMLGAGCRVIEEGLCGRTTVWEDPVEGMKSGLTQLVPILLSHTPLDLVIIMLGTNDFKSRFAVSAFDISMSIGRLVNTVRCPLADYYTTVPEVLVIAPPPVVNMANVPFREAFIGAEEKSLMLGGYLEQYCRENNILFLDAAKHIVSSTKDGIHLEPEEHKKLAEAVSVQIREVFGNR